jgi:hypothetical protein
VATTLRTFCLLKINIIKTNHTTVTILISELMKEARSMTSKKHPKTNAQKPANGVESRNLAKLTKYVSATNNAK